MTKRRKRPLRDTNPPAIPATPGQAPYDRVRSGGLQVRLDYWFQRLKDRFRVDLGGLEVEDDETRSPHRR